MRVTFEERADNIVFKVSDFDVQYEKVLEMCFYQLEGESYIKTFQKTTKNIERIKANYLNNAEEMFSQLGYSRPIPWDEALLEFVKRLEATQIDWWLTGSCAACIRGIPLNPHDVDIMVSSKDVDQLSNIFIDHIVEPIIDTNGWLTKDFGVIFLHSRIDIASDPQACLDDPEPVDCGPYAKGNLEKVIWKGYLYGIEVSADFDGEVPKGMACTLIPESLYAVFHYPPYDYDKLDASVYETIKEKMENWNPGEYGYEYNDSVNPTYQKHEPEYYGQAFCRPIKKL